MADRRGKNKELVSEIQKIKKSAEAAWTSAVTEFYEDFEFYHSRQWTDADAADAAKRKVPALSINIVKKIVDLVSGIQRQNKADIGVYPVEASDEMTCEVMSRLLKWTTKQGNFESRWSGAFKDAATCGLGWAYLGINLEKDPINGDIELLKVSPLDVLPDPDFTELDLSDCGYLFYHKRVDKNKAKNMHPSFAAEIDKIKTEGKISLFNRFRATNANPADDNRVEIIEYWRREYEMRTMYVDQDEVVSPWEGTEEEQETFAEANNVSFFEKKVPVIKLTITVGDDLVVYDGVNPFRIDEYPFVPVFAYYSSSFDDWQYKAQGVIRVLKDLQREKNKRRSQILQSTNKIAHSGYYLEEGSVKDEGALRETGGKAGAIIKYRMGRKRPERIEPPDVPAALIQIEQMFTNDTQYVSINPDLLGMITEKGSAGVTVQLRQKQGLTSLQEIFDNHATSYRNLGLKLVKMILQWYSPGKIMRILGSDFPIREQIKLLEKQDVELKAQIGKQIDASQASMEPDEDRIIQNEQFRRQAEQQAMEIQQQIQTLQAQEQEFWAQYVEFKGQLKYDCVVDEVINSPTYRLAAVMQLSTIAQSGVQVPPELVIEMADLPRTIKDKLMGYIQQQQQMQMAMAQQEAQIRQQKTAVEMAKAYAGMSGKINPDQMPGEEGEVQ